MINCQAWEQQLLKSLPWGSSRNPTWTRCQFSESTSSKPKNSQRATDPRQKKCSRATHPRSRFQGSGLKVLGSCSHAISSASHLPTHTTWAIWSKAMLSKGNLVQTTFKAMSKCSVPLFKILIAKRWSQREASVLIRVRAFGFMLKPWVCLR